MNQWEGVGLKAPGYKSLARTKNGLGLLLKKSMSNMASGKGRLYFSRLLYKPVPGERKSGIPGDEESFINNYTEEKQNICTILILKKISLRIYSSLHTYWSLKRILQFNRGQIKVTAGATLINSKCSNSSPLSLLTFGNTPLLT